MCAAEHVASVVDRVLSLDYATVSPEVQPAQQPESAPHSTYQSAPMNHPDAGPVLNGLYEQACLTHPCPFLYLQGAFPQDLTFLCLWNAS